MLAYPWRFAIVGELQDVNHVLALFFQDVLPRNVWNGMQGRAHGIVVVSGLRVSELSYVAYSRRHTSTARPRELDWNLVKAPFETPVATAKPH